MCSGLKNRDINLKTYSVLKSLKPRTALTKAPTLQNGSGRLGAVSEQGSGMFLRLPEA